MAPVEPNLEERRRIERLAAGAGACDADRGATARRSAASSSATESSTRIRPSSAAAGAWSPATWRRTGGAGGGGRPAGRRSWLPAWTGSARAARPSGSPGGRAWREARPASPTRRVSARTRPEDGRERGSARAWRRRPGSDGPQPPGPRGAEDDRTCRARRRPPRATLAAELEDGAMRSICERLDSTPRKRPGCRDRGRSIPRRDAADQPNHGDVETDLEPSRRVERSHVSKADASRFPSRIEDAEVAHGMGGDERARAAPAAADRGAGPDHRLGAADPAPPPRRARRVPSGAPPPARRRQSARRPDRWARWARPGRRPWRSSDRRPPRSSRCRSRARRRCRSPPAPLRWSCPEGKACRPCRTPAPGLPRWTSRPRAPGWASRSAGPARPAAPLGGARELVDHAVGPARGPIRTGRRSRRRLGLRHHPHRGAPVHRAGLGEVGVGWVDGPRSTWRPLWCRRGSARPPPSAGPRRSRSWCWAARPPFRRSRGPAGAESRPYRRSHQPRPTPGGEKRRRRREAPAVEVLGQHGAVRLVGFGRRVEGHHRAREFVVAEAPVGWEVGRRVAPRPVEHAGLGIGRAGRSIAAPAIGTPSSSPQVAASFAEGSGALGPQEGPSASRGTGYRSRTTSPLSASSARMRTSTPPSSSSARTGLLKAITAVGTTRPGPR